MQRTIYECDQCKKETSRTAKHISLRFSCNSGIAHPPESKGNTMNHWRVIPDLNGKFRHFCNTKCLAAWFDALIKGDSKES